VKHISVAHKVHNNHNKMDYCKLMFSTVLSFLIDQHSAAVTANVISYLNNTF